VIDFGTNTKAICKKLNECWKAANKMKTEHDGCLGSFWWIYPSCWSKRNDPQYSIYVGKGLAFVNDRLDAFRDLNNLINGQTNGVPKNCGVDTVPYP